jgi:PAS domain-containing protein
VLVMDENLVVRSANRAFFRTFKVSATETEGRPIFDLGNGQWNIPKLRMLLQDILPRDSTFEGLRVEHEFPDIGRRIMILNARKLERGIGQPGMIVLAIEELTELLERQ